MGIVSKKRKNKSDYGENFIHPDGGYGWVICITSGLANLSILVIFEQFGILYRDKLLGIGLSHSAITSIINLCIAIGSLTGFLNGPIFRRFSYRQVGMTGSLIATIAIFFTSLANTFESFLFTFGILLAFGSGITYSANCLVLNVYFSENRSKASSWAWTIAGIGTMIFPYIMTYLVEQYGVQGTILIVSAISANSFVFSMTYQPVLWHAKRNEAVEKKMELLNGNKKNNKSVEDKICKMCNRILVDSELKQIIDNGEVEKGTDDLQIIMTDLETPIAESLTESLTLLKCNCNISNIKKTERSNGFTSSTVKSNPSVCSKAINYFELDLLKNYTFLNIVVGLTLSSFAELNYTFLTPFFLKDFGLDSHEVAFLMSIPSIPDLTCRFLIQFLVKKVKWNNRIFYLVGITSMTICRIVITLRPPYIIICIAFFCLGIGKAFLTIFYGIIIPDHVPIKSLPAALGIGRLFDGIFPIICGSIVGYIRDLSSYQVALQFLNFLTMITVISWTTELLLARKKKKINSTC